MSTEPPGESDRLASLRSLDLLDTPDEERFDRITRLACKVLRVPIALVSLVDADRQWFKSAQGLQVRETRREISFCSRAIESDRVFDVPDATRDERFADNPLVTSAPDIRMYAGKPIAAPDGHRIGTLCVIDHVPRQLSEEEVMLLEDLAALVETELRAASLGVSERDLRRRLGEAERRAAVDDLTRLWNRGAIVSVLESELERSARSRRPMAAMMIDIDHFKQFNDDHGHAVGDAVLAEVAARLRAGLRPYDSVGRYGGEEFVAVLPDSGRSAAESVAERLRDRVRASPVGRGDLWATVSAGVCVVPDATSSSASAVLACADAAMYAAKRQGRDGVVVRELDGAEPG